MSAARKQKLHRHLWDSLCTSGKHAVALTSAYPAVQEDKQNLLAESSGHRTPVGHHSFLWLPSEHAGRTWSLAMWPGVSAVAQKGEKRQVGNCAEANGQAQMDEVLDFWFWGNTLTPG